MLSAKKSSIAQSRRRYRRPYMPTSSLSGHSYRFLRFSSSSLVQRRRAWPGGASGGEAGKMDGTAEPVGVSADIGF